MEDKEKNVVMSSKQPGAREMDADSTNVDSKHDMATVEDFDYYDEIRPVTEPSIYESGLSSASQVRGWFNGIELSVNILQETSLQHY